jgi:hypothetical protein
MRISIRDKRGPGGDLCMCGGMTDTCDGCQDCLGVGCARPGVDAEPVQHQPVYDADCPACLRSLDHSVREHSASLLRARAR